MTPASTTSATSERLYERALAPGPRREVRRVEASKLRDEARGLYDFARGEPALVTGATPDDPLVQTLSIETLGALLSGAEIEGYSRETGERESVPADAFFRELRAGRGRHNVVDHPVRATPLHGRLRAPPFLRDNWLPARADLGISPLSLTISPAGNYTALHVDAYGMQGWMLLLAGAKRWTFIAPDDARSRVDPTTAEVGDAGAESWAGVTRWETLARAGDLVYIPPGWAHQVLTLEESLGVGGSLLNEHEIAASMAAWRFERSLGYSEELDLPALVEARMGPPSAVA